MDQIYSNTRRQSVRSARPPVSYVSISNKQASSGLMRHSELVRSIKSLSVSLPSTPSEARQASERNTTNPLLMLTAKCDDWVADQFLNLVTRRKLTFVVCLLLFQVLATSKFISGWELTYDSAHLVYSAASLEQVTGTITYYPTQSHYPDTEPTLS